MAIFFTSDTHFGHEAIIHLCKRPFDTVEEMNETLIARWNETVAPGDTVYRRFQLPQCARRFRVPARIERHDPSQP